MNLKNVNVLLAEDDIDDCNFFEEALKELVLPTNLVVVHEGEQLMEQLTNSKNVLPDVLFLDLNMPRKNGFECLTEIKKSNKLSQLPIIIFSTSLEPDVVNLLYNNGALYFIRKPVEFQKFKKIIQHSLMLIMEKKIVQPSREQFVITI